MLEGRHGRPHKESGPRVIEPAHSRKLHLSWIYRHATLGRISAQLCQPDGARRADDRAPSLRAAPTRRRPSSRRPRSIPEGVAECLPISERPHCSSLRTVPPSSPAPISSSTAGSPSGHILNIYPQVDHLSDTSLRFNDVSGRMSVLQSLLIWGPST